MVGSTEGHNGRRAQGANVNMYVQTLTDKEYQRLRDAAVAIIREMGVDCGGSNVQMGINPVDGAITASFKRRP